MKIHLQTPNSPYSATLDADVMEVTLKEVFLGVNLITEHGEKLSVCMRDTGYELVYEAPGQPPITVELKDGTSQTHG